MEAIQYGLQFFDDIRSQHIGVRKAVQVGEGLVLDPEDVQTGLSRFRMSSAENLRQRPSGLASDHVFARS